MIDLFTLIALTVIVCGFVAGVQAISHKPRSIDTRICSCGHGSGLHPEPTGPCRGREVRMSYYKSGGRAGKKSFACACIKFDGQRPLNVEEIIRSWEPPKES